MKKIIIASMILVSLLVSGCGKNTKEDEIKNDEVKDNEVKDNIQTNVNEGIINEQTIEGIKMTNTSLVITNGISKLTTSVTNTLQYDYQLEEYQIIFKNENDEVIIAVPGYVGDIIKSGETRTINTTIDIDLSNAKNIEYRVIKQY